MQDSFRLLAVQSQPCKTPYAEDVRQVEHLAPLLAVLLRLAPGGLPSHASVVTGLQLLAESVSDPQAVPEDAVPGRDGLA